MKKKCLYQHLLVLCYLLCSLSLFSQNTKLDSLRTALAQPGISDSLAFQTLTQLYYTFQGLQAYDSCLVYSKQTQLKAERVKDSIQWRNALGRMADTYFNLKDSLKGRTYRRQHQEMATSVGLKLEYPEYLTTHDAYGYSNLILENSLRILKDPSGKLTYQQIKKQPFQLNNSQGNLDPDGVYWMKLKISGARDSIGRYTFMIGRGIYSWNNIEVYYERGDSLIYQQTGLKLAASDKAIPDAFNFVEVELAAQETIYLYVRVEGAKPNYLPPALQLNYLQTDKMLELEGYR